MRGNRSGERLPFEAAENHPRLIRPCTARSPSPKGERWGSRGLRALGGPRQWGWGNRTWRALEAFAYFARTWEVLRRHEGATSSGLAPFGQLSQRGGRPKRPNPSLGREKGMRAKFSFGKRQEDALQGFPLEKSKRLRRKAFLLGKGKGLHPPKPPLLGMAPLAGGG